MRLGALRTLVIVAIGANLVGCGSAPRSVDRATDPYLAAPTAAQATVDVAATTTWLQVADPSTTFVTVAPESTTTLWSVTTLPAGWPTTTVVEQVPRGLPVVTLEPSWDATPPSPPVHLRVGDTIALVARADSVLIFHEDGSVYDPLPPGAADAALLRDAIYTDTCQVHTTCAAWVAVAPGLTTIFESGPSGIVCDLLPQTTQLLCGGVSAAWWSQDVIIDER